MSEMSFNGLHQSLTPTDQKKLSFANYTVGQEDSLKTPFHQIFGKSACQKNHLCQVSRLLFYRLTFEDTSQSRKWKEKHVLFCDTMKSFVQQIDAIISLCWIHKTLLQSGCGCFFNFCTFRLVESTKKNGAKSLFQILQGHSFVWMYFPFPPCPWHQTQPYKWKQTGGPDEVSGGCAKFLSKLCSLTHSLRIERAAQLLSEAELVYMPRGSWGELSRDPPTLILPRLCQTRSRTPYKLPHFLFT